MNGTSTSVAAASTVPAELLTISARRTPHRSMSEPENGDETSRTTNGRAYTKPRTTRE
jgi:hypothetical protein